MMVFNLKSKEFLENACSLTLIKYLNYYSCSLLFMKSCARAVKPYLPQPRQSNNGGYIPVFRYKSKHARVFADITHKHYWNTYQPSHPKISLKTSAKRKS